MKFKDVYIKCLRKDRISNIIKNDLSRVDSRKEIFKILNYYFFHLLVKNSKDTELLKTLLGGNFDLVNDSLNDLILFIEPTHNLNSRTAVSQRKMFGQTLRNNLDQYFGIKTHQEIKKDYWNKNLYTVLFDMLFEQNKKDFNMYRIIKGFTFLSYIINESARN